MSLQARFYAGLKPDGECIVWTKHRNRGGYGVVRMDGRQGRSVLAHRVAAFFAGLIPDLKPAPKKLSQRAFVLHTCDNPPCCNPDHLFVGNYSDNQFDAYRKGRAGKAKGANHTNAKLTFQQARKILERYAAGGVTQTQLAKEYGVSQICISLLTRGKTYV